MTQTATTKNDHLSDGPETQTLGSVPAHEEDPKETGLAAPTTRTCWASRWPISKKVGFLPRSRPSRGISSPCF